MSLSPRSLRLCFATIALGAWLLVVGPAHAVEIEIDRDASGERYVAGELLVTYAGSASAAEIETANAAAGAEVEANLREIDARLLELPSATEPAAQNARERALRGATRLLRSTPSVESVGLNYILEPAASFDDPLLGQQWALPQIGLPAAWDASVGAGTRIAIIDSGLDRGHVEFSGAKVSATKEYFSLTPFDGYPEDNVGHGTHVAGIAAANTGNAQGVAGTSPQSSLLILKVCDEAINCTTAAVANALVDVGNDPAGVDVANISLGGYNPSSALQNAVNYAASRDVLVVAAAGNEARGEPFYPAAYPNALAVASTDIADAPSRFSNFGDWVDIAAPGGQADNPPEEDILSAYPQFFGGYEYLDGTSMSAPFVSGVAALLAGQGMNAAAIRSRLESTAADLGPCGRDPVYGAGRLDAAAALGVSSPLGSCIPAPSAGPDACAQAKFQLLQSRKALKSAKKTGNLRKIKRARKAVRKWRKRVRKDCG